MRIVYMPGGVGAVAYNNIVAQRPDEGGAIVAFSGGSLLNLAQGKFGRYSVDDVRWLAAIGADYGVVVVRDDSAYQTLGALMEALKKDPSAVVFGTGGSVGSQDWMKAALTARAAGVDPRKMRFVAFEGGGEGITALRGNHVQVFMGDVGALALGAALGCIAVIVRQEIMLFIMGGVFVAETVSVMLQVSWFKYTKRRYGTGRRIFRMAPLHHHFEVGGVKESQVVVRFWIVTMVLVLFGLSSLKLR